MEVKAEFAAVCGNFCGACRFLGASCRGCLSQGGNVFWGTCKRYVCCVRQKELEHCGLCEEFPCPLFDLNPEKLDERTFLANRQRAIGNLVRRRSVGTDAWLKEQNKEE